MLSLFLLQITLPHPQINSTAALPIKPSIIDQAAALTNQAATIASHLKTPSPSIWKCHRHWSEAAIATSVWSCHAASIWTHLSHGLKLQHRSSNAHLSHSTKSVLATTVDLRPPPLTKKATIAESLYLSYLFLFLFLIWFVVVVVVDFCRYLVGIYLVCFELCFGSWRMRWLLVGGY